MPRRALEIVEEEFRKRLESRGDGEWDRDVVLELEADIGSRIEKELLAPKPDGPLTTCEVDGCENRARFEGWYKPKEPFSTARHMKVCPDCVTLLYGGIAFVADEDESAPLPVGEG